jgi:putative two-component system response regulator
MAAMTHGDNPRVSVLVVDDNHTNRELLRRILSIEGYVVYLAGTGQEAIEIAKTKSPHVVILDVMMPGMSGFQVCEAIRENDGETRTPVIMVTALDQMEDRVQGIKVGADDFLSKPFATPELLARVSSLVRIRQLNIKIAEQARELSSQNARLELEVQERTKQLQEVTIGLVTALEKVNVLNDEDTGNHIYRVCEFSQELARAYGLPEDLCLQIGQWASLHDVGKVGTPDAILKKPAKLDAAEWEIMKQHATFGHELLLTAKAPEIARNIAWTHHEKWSGGGYPRGLREDEIPIEGRIVAIADVFDALTTRRVYKPAWDTEKTQGVLREERGKHFDPQLIDAYFAISDKFREIQLRLADAPSRRAP